MNSKENVALSDELLERIDSLFDASSRRASESTDSIRENNINIGHDLRYLVPELPKSAESATVTSLRSLENLSAYQKIQKRIGNSVLRKTVLSEDFTIDIWSNELEIEEMAVTQLSATKQSYMGSLAVGRKPYEISEGSSVYNISKTVWTDWHGSKAFDLTILTPNRELLSSLDSTTTLLVPKLISGEEKRTQIDNIDMALRKFGY